MTNDDVGTEPLVSVGVEIKQSDGNYGSVGGHLIISRVPSDISAEDLDKLIGTGEIAFDVLRQRLMARFTVTVKADDPENWEEGVDYQEEDVPFEEVPAPQPVKAVAPRNAPELPVCPRCGGAVWDNRQGKKNPKAPDFRCRDKECVGEDGFITGGWLTKDGGVSWPGLKL